jgi:hypothetical protein
MKTPKKLLALTVFAIAVTSLFSVQPAQAFTITLEQMGSNVVGNGSGAFNLTGLTFSGSTIAVGNGIIANVGTIGIGPTSANVDDYTGFTGPTSFGSGNFFGASFGSGDKVTFKGLSNVIELPQGYSSGASLSDSMTFNNATFASLGLTPGTYVWTWGTGQANQNFTLVIGGSVPDGGSTVSLLGCALLGLAALRRKLGC